jgi:polyisoprenoid-binding protein YceI
MKEERLRVMIAAVVLAAGATMLHAQAKDWKIDPAHSEADFAIKHMAISTVHGSFRGVSGIIHLDPANVSKSSVEAMIDVNTVDSGVAYRDGDLKSARFFDTTKYPTMTFKSKSISKTGDHYAVMGDLTLHGVTKGVVLDLETPGKEQIGSKGEVHRGFTASTTLHRQDFGLTWNDILKSGDTALGDDVKIELDIEALQQ